MDSPWVITIAGGVLVGLVLYFVFGIGKNQSSTKNEIKKSPVNVNGDSNVINSTVITNVKDQKFRESEQLNSAPKTTKPTAVEILKDIKSRPLFHQEQTGTIYEDSKILWRLKLSSIRQDDEIFHVTAAEIQQKPLEVAIVSFEVKARQYPELKSMMQYDEFYIEGEIQKVSPGSIFLKNTRILFSKSSRQ